MKDTYLEGAQQEVFAEAVKRVKITPSPAFLNKLQKKAMTMFYTFADNEQDFDGSDITITNPAKFQKIVEAYALEALGDALEQYFDDERNFEAMEEFIQECVSKKAAKTTSSDEENED